MISNLQAIETAGRSGALFAVQPDDIHISYLPLAHIFERMMVHLIARSGAAIGFYSGDVLKLTDDMKELIRHFSFLY